MSRDNEEQEQQGVAESVASGHPASVNQVRHEPVPASHQDDRRTEAVERNEEFSQGRAEARPDRRDGSGPHPE